MERRDSVGAYEKLLLLPLLQGLSKDDITTIAGRVKLAFGRVAAGKYIIRTGEKTAGLWFVLDDSEVLVSHSLRGGVVGFEETLSGIRMFGAETLFGMSQIYEFSVKSLNECSTLYIRKSDVINHILYYEVCRFNMLGYLSLRLQRVSTRLSQAPEQRLMGRLVQFLEHNFIYPAGDKRVIAKMTDMAGCLFTTRRHLSNLLNSLQREGLVVLGRKHFEIKRFQDLVNYNAAQRQLEDRI